MAECIRSIAASFSEPGIEEMKRMKTIVKERLAAYDTELKGRIKDVDVLRQSLDKSEQAFMKTQSELKRAHSKSVDPTQGSRHRAFSWSPIGVEDKDKLFERIQRLMNDQVKTASESEFDFAKLTAKHLSSFNRLGVVVNELGSVRRRVNRRIITEVKQIVPKLEKNINQLLSTSIPALIERLDKTCVLSPDFAMKLPPLSASLTALVGADRHSRLSAMREAPPVVEYRAVQSYLAKEHGELSFARNERIEILKKDPSGWWTGRNERGQTGVLPSVLVAQRPAGAAMPLQQAPAVSYRPHVDRQGSFGTWKTSASTDDRIELVKNSPPFAFLGIVQFEYHAAGISVEPGEIVEVEGVDGDKAVRVRTDKGQVGSVPLNIVSIKYKNDRPVDNRENDLNLSNW